MRFILMIVICLISGNASAQKEYAQLVNNVRKISMDADFMKATFDSDINNQTEIVGVGGIGFQSAMQPSNFTFNFIKYLIEKKGFQTLLLDLPDYQLREINAFLKNAKLGSSENIVDSIVNIHPIYDLGVVLSTTEFKRLIKYLKERNLQKPHSAVSIGGFGIGIPPVGYLIAKYTLETDSGFTVKMNEKIINKQMGEGEGAKFGDFVSWYYTRKDYLENKLSDLDFRQLTIDIENMEIFTQLTMLNERQSFISYRDSSAANHIINHFGKKSILLSRNMQIAKHISNPASEEAVKTLGRYLANTFQNNYYALLTDFSDHMIFTSTNGSEESELQALPKSTANVLNTRFGVNQGIILSAEFGREDFPLILNNIIANKNINEELLSPITGTNLSFDALLILEIINSVSSEL